MGGKISGISSKDFWCISARIPETIKRASSEVPRYWQGLCPFTFRFAELFFQMEALELSR